MGMIRRLLTMMGLGAGLVYLFDPETGRRRRALIRDQGVRLAHDMGDMFEKGSRDLGNRAVGLVAEASRLARREQVRDEVLVQRVRSHMGWVVPYASAIAVEANNGQVTLRGPALASDVEPLLSQAARVRGVQSVENGLDVHVQPGDVPGLNSDRERWTERRARAMGTWAPGPRLLAFVGGVFLMLSGMFRGGFLGTLRSSLGLGLVVRSMINKPVRHIVGLTDRAGVMEVQKTININVPVEQVFAFWRNYENFPEFMSYVREVIDLGNDRSRWVVEGPAGLPVSWEARITHLIPNRLIEWRSEPDAAVQQVGTVHFSPNDAGGTKVDVHLTYTPPAGVLGHTVASLFGSNPRQQMDTDLLRLKGLLEEVLAPAADEAKRYYRVTGGQRRTRSRVYDQAPAGQVEPVTEQPARTEE